MSQSSGFLQVILQTNEYSKGPVDQICLIGHDLHLKTDIVSERQVYLAKRMAKDLGVDFVDARKDPGRFSHRGES